MLFLNKKSTNKDVNSAYSKAGPFLSIVYFFIASIFLFGFIGYKIDQAFGYDFVFLLTGLFAGFTLGFYKLYIIVKHMDEDK